METLAEALERLEARGFTLDLRPLADGRLAVDSDTALAPETLVVEEVVRFEGVSDPEDEAVLFALRSQDGRVRGTFSTTYGTQTGPEAAAVIERLGPILRAR